LSARTREAQGGKVIGVISFAMAESRRRHSEEDVAFAQALPRIRARSAAHLRLNKLPREKVLAAVVQLLEKTLIRVGNEEYAKHNKSFGLTTLRDQHATISGSAVRFEFRGKSGIQHAIDLRDARLARIVKTIRGAGVKTPVLFLTTLGGIDDRVEGLEAGGDDYLVKPFSFAELIARINALARRAPLTETQTSLQVADLELDLRKRSVARGGRRIELQPQEFKLLEYLMRHAGRVVTRTMLLENVWEFHFDPQTTVVETHISRLRSKIDHGFSKPLIHTVRGSGYCIREDA
jgi:two-component system OmpR family response regulator